MIVGSLAVSIVAKTQKFAKSMSFVQKLNKQAVKSFQRLGGIASGALAAIGAGSVTAGIALAAKRIDAMAKASDKLGIGIDKLAGLQLAAQQTGVGINTLNTGVQRMVRRIAEAAGGTGVAKDALIELGLNAQRLNQLAPDRQFARIADAMAKVATQGDKVRLTNKLFDSEGVALVNTLKLGSAGLADMQQKAIDMGIALDRHGAANVEKMNDAIHLVSTAVQGAFNKITVQLSPAITDIANKTADWIASMNSGLSGSRGGFGELAEWIGFAADALDVVRIGFLAMRASVNSAIAFAVKQFDNLQKVIVDIADLIPGLTLKTSSFITTLSEDMARGAAKQWEIVNDAWLAPPPSDAIKKMFEPVKQEAIKTAKEIAELPKLPPLVQDIVAGGSKFYENPAFNIGKLLGQGSNQLARLAQANKVSPAVAAVAQAPRAAALQRGTQEARSASLRNVLGRNSPMKQVAERAKEQVQLLGEIRDQGNKPQPQFVAKPI